MWVKLLQPRQITINGINTRFQKGDWVEVGKQTALRWLNDKVAEKPGFNYADEYIDYTSGLLVIGKLTDNERVQVTESIPGFEIAYGPTPELLFSETMIYNDKAHYFRPEVISTGFKWLENFQLCVPMFSYETLACDVGNEQDRMLAKNILKELRVPLYNTHLMFVRRCSETKELIKLWQEYNEQISNENLAFLCALYEVKPLHLALPSTWIKK